jgi:integrase
MNCQHCGSKMKNTQAIKVGDLLALVQRDYRDKEKRSLYGVNLYINNQLLPYFGEKSAAYLLEKNIDDYKDKRLAEGASKVTLNRELAVLKRGFSLGLKRRLLKSTPFIELFPEPEPREGHYEYEDFLKFIEVAKAVRPNKNFDGPVVADIVYFAYFSGWRLSECLGLHKDWIKVKERIAILPAKKHKNKRPKVLPLDGEMADMIFRRLACASPDGYLFHRNGRQIKSIRRICLTICNAVGLDSAHFFHNLRRSFRTNLGRTGTDDQTGMKLMGHRTLSVYNNYNQIDLARQREALQRMQNTLDASTEKTQASSGPCNSSSEQIELAERVGFEPTNPVKDYLISSQVRGGKLAKYLRKLIWRR